MGSEMCIRDRLALAVRPPQSGGNNTPEGESTTGSSGLRVRCPGCGSHSDLTNASTLNNFDCATCGEPIRIIGDTATEPTNQPRQLGHFSLIEPVGAGSFGTVWRAKDSELDRIVAIKIPRREQLSARDVEAVIHEARASASLNHPNIVSVHEIGRADDTVYIVSDFIDGGTLDDFLNDRVLNARESATMCATIADALHLSLIHI